eukprot:Gb_11054 [translate_table: standard]
MSTKQACRKLPCLQIVVFFCTVYCYLLMICNASRLLHNHDGQNHSIDSYGGGRSPYGKGYNNNHNDEAMAFLIPQNNARAEVGEYPLVWDHRVESYARWWAEQRRSDCQLIHSDGPYGENNFWGSGHDWTPLDAANDWVEEKQYYTYETNSCDGDEMCGHYTQIVWRNSRRLGCARVVCDNGDVFMTCNYDPPGNYIGEKPY